MKYNPSFKRFTRLKDKKNNVSYNTHPTCPPPYIGAARACFVRKENDFVITLSSRLSSLPRDGWRNFLLGDTHSHSSCPPPYKGATGSRFDERNKSRHESQNARQIKSLVIDSCDLHTTSSNLVIFKEACHITNLKNKEANTYSSRLSSLGIDD
ncbi:hypothetical protein ACFE04_011261 [Oxalis oulophora]